MRRSEVKADIQQISNGLTRSVVITSMTSSSRSQKVTCNGQSILLTIRVNEEYNESHAIGTCSARDLRPHAVFFSLPSSSASVSIVARAAKQKKKQS